MFLRVFFLIIATVLFVLLVLALIRGQKYQSLVDSLGNFDYPLHDLYVVGYFLADTIPFISLRGPLKESFVDNISKVDDTAYADYYAHLKWAQFVTFTLILLMFGFIMGSIIGGPASFFAVILTLILSAAIFYMSIYRYNEFVHNRREDCEAEFPNMVAKLALLLNSGMVIRDAWKLIAESGDGVIYELMRKSCKCMDNGDSDKEAIMKFGFWSDSQDIKKFTSSMLQALDKGNSEIADFFIEQNNELWSHKRQVCLQKGEIAAGKLLIPVAITFAGIILIIVVAVFQNMAF